jgi:DNA modification methylase
VTVTIALHHITRVPIGRVREAPWNANLVSRAMMVKIKQSLRTFGAVENNVLRPDWTVGARTMEEVARRRTALMSESPEWYETLSGNHRLTIYREDGITEVPAVVVELPDPQAKMLAQALNRTRGQQDHKDKLADILRDITADLPPSDVASILPHSEKDITKIIASKFGTDAHDDETPEVPEVADSRVGTIYHLGPHRLLCGDAKDASLVAQLLDGEQPLLMVTDPPYGVSLDQGWRDRMARQAGFPRMGTAQGDSLEGDEGFGWVPALGMVESITVAYVWHAAAYTREVWNHIESFGFEFRQQIIWNKAVHSLSRSSYHWKHEPCIYATRKNTKTPWYGGRSQTTVWDAVSPKHPYGQKGEDEGRWDHPTVKPVVLFETPILNHLAPGEACYDPFVGSGTAIIAAARAGRRCFAAEVNPKYADVVRRRWTKWAAKHEVEPGPGVLA